MKSMSLGVKVSLIIVIMIVAIMVATVVIVSFGSSSLVQKLASNEAKIYNHAFARELQQLEATALSSAKIIASSNDVVGAIIGKDEAKLRDSLFSLSEGVDTIMVCDINGNVLIRIHDDQKGDNVQAQKTVAAALNGSFLSTIDTDSTVGMATRGSAPIRDSNYNIIGAVVCGHNLSNLKYVDDFKSLLDCETTIFSGDTRISTTLVDRDGERNVGTRADSIVTNTVIHQKQNFSSQLEFFGHTYFTYYSPLTVNNEVIGILFTGKPVDEAMAEKQLMMNEVLLLGIALGIICVVIIILYIRQAIIKPLHKVSGEAENIAIGDIEIEGMDNGTSPTHNEVILLERSFSHMIDSFRKQAYVLARLAEGDYTSKVEVRSEKDVINLAIELVLEETLDVLHQVATTGIQVANGSKQIAHGAQALAQGATEQAAVVQQLSSSMTDIAHKTKDNAAMATQAAKLAGTIKQSAEKGSVQMSDMMEAVKEINQASHSISKVIKVIDDIAFQTNILALNAAVEAARAGAAGKGFAVVAEEVRNLASKSAEAAKDTGTLISNSIEKAELGSRIANDTAQSLNGIVKGIIESSKIVNEIAMYSEEQYAAISQINSGVEQVAQVVQQNSATAQESAAASEEMSSQSVILEDLIKQFQLREFLLSEKN